MLSQPEPGLHSDSNEVCTTLVMWSFPNGPMYLTHQVLAATFIFYLLISTVTITTYICACTQLSGLEVLNECDAENYTSHAILRQDVSKTPSSLSPLTFT